MSTMTMPMLETYPREINIDRGRLGETIDLLMSCSQTCTACADSCLSEESVMDLAKCIRTNLDCADVCDATARVLSRHTGYDARISRSLLAACAVTCASCADECERHASMHEHCRICAEVCRRCAESCRNLAAVMS